MLLYLDLCTIQRPLDDKTQLRIAIESEIILGILSLIEAGMVELISSEALLFEANKNPHLFRRAHSLDTLAKATRFVALDEQTERSSRHFIETGIRPLDALHLACAEAAQADFLCTCDDKFLQKARRIPTLSTTVVSPIELSREIEKWTSRQNL